MILIISFFLFISIYSKDVKDGKEENGSIYECDGIPSNSEYVCNGHGVCTSTDSCDCLMCTYVGDFCDREFCLEGRNICTVHSDIEKEEEESCPTPVTIVERVERPNSCVGMHWSIPCSPSLIGNALIIMVSGYFLVKASKWIGVGGEMLLVVFPPTIIGGFVMPVLGCIPDIVVLIACTSPMYLGDPDLSQGLMSIGMGSIAGSTIFLTTLVFGMIMVYGKSDLKDGVQKEGRGGASSTTNFSLFGQGVSFNSDVTFNAFISFLTSLLFVVIQYEDIHVILFGSKREFSGDKSQKLLITSLLCLFSFITYTAYQIVQTQRDLSSFDDPGQEEEDDRLNIENQRGDQDDDFSDSDELSYRIVHKVIGDDDEIDELEEEDDEIVEEYELWPSYQIVTSAVLKVLIGLSFQTLFSFPMVQSLHATSKLLDVNVFYLSLVITPLCSNLSEIQATFVYVGKKVRLHNQICLSQIFAAAIMNNTLLLGVFTFILFWFGGAGLEWRFFSESVGIWFVTIAMGLVLFVSKFTKYTLEMYWIVFIFLLYPISVGVIVFSRRNFQQLF